MTGVAHTALGAIGQIAMPVHDLARGVEFRDEPPLIARMPDHELWLPSFADGEGNTHALMQERRS
jgi:hypothetical protein